MTLSSRYIQEQIESLQLFQEELGKHSAIKHEEAVSIGKAFRGLTEVLLALDTAKDYVERREIFMRHEQRMAQEVTA